jgi:hypothetical protein
MALRTLLLVALITIIWLNSTAGKGVVSRKSLKQQIKKLEKDLNKAEANILNIQVASCLILIFLQKTLYLHIDLILIYCKAFS